MKNGRLVVRHNSLVEDVPFAIVMKAFGIVTDQEIAHLVNGGDVASLDKFAPTLEECSQLKIYTQHQALEYVGLKSRQNRRPMMIGQKRVLVILLLLFV